MWALRKKKISDLQQKHGLQEAPGMKFLIVCLFYKLPKLED